MISYLSNTEHFRKFEQLYLEVREKEKRVYKDEVVAKLPFISSHDSIHYREWKMRAHSFQKLNRYFQKKDNAIIMDLGCGNGWLSARLSDLPGKEIYGVDINEPELQQADRIFLSSNLHFCFGNIYENIFPAEMFDVIILNSCIQYFEELSELIKRLFYFLKPGGEIHIVDSPFYEMNELEAARQRSIEYYQKLGFPELSKYYFHHTMDELKPFRYQNLSGYNFIRKVKSIFRQELPNNFYWILVEKNNNKISD